MRLIHSSCADMRRVCVPTRTGSTQQYSHFRRKLSAPVDLLVRRTSASCARFVAISRRNQDITATARFFNVLNMCQRQAFVVTERTQRNRHSYSGRNGIRRRRFIVGRIV